MATSVMGMPVIPGEPAVGPPGHEPAERAAAWIEAVPMFGKAIDALGWFEYVLQRLTLMLVILGVVEVALSRFLFWQVALRFFFFSKRALSPPKPVLQRSKAINSWRHGRPTRNRVRMRARTWPECPPPGGCAATRATRTRSSSGSGRRRWHPHQLQRRRRLGGARACPPTSPACCCCCFCCCCSCWSCW